MNEVCVHMCTYTHAKKRGLQGWEEITLKGYFLLYLLINFYIHVLCHSRHEAETLAHR